MSAFDGSMHKVNVSFFGKMEQFDSCTESCNMCSELFAFVTLTSIIARKLQDGDAKVKFLSEETRWDEYSVNGKEDSCWWFPSLLLTYLFCLVLYGLHQRVQEEHHANHQFQSGIVWWLAHYIAIAVELFWFQLIHFVKLLKHVQEKQIFSHTKIWKKINNTEKCLRLEFTFKFVYALHI